MNSPQSLARYVSKGYSCSGKVASPLGATAAHADRRCYARHRAAVLALLCYSIIIQRFSPGDDRGVVWLIAHRAQAVSFAHQRGGATKKLLLCRSWQWHVLQVAGAPAPAQQPARPLAVSCSWATRAVGKAALIDAHDLAENERGRGRRIYGPACREARAAFHNRGKKN